MTDLGILAKFACRSDISKAGDSKRLGVVYAIRWDNGLTKIGKTLDIATRVEAHRKSTAKYGLTISAVMFTRLHKAYSKGETYVLENTRGAQTRDSQEWFMSCSWKETEICLLNLKQGILREKDISKMSPCKAIVEEDWLFSASKDLIYDPRVEDPLAEELNEMYDATVKSANFLIYTQDTAEYYDTVDTLLANMHDIIHIGEALLTPIEVVDIALD